MDPLPGYENFDGIGLAELVRNRHVRPEELLEAAIARVAQRNPALNAVVAHLYERARTAIAAGVPAGPFTGVPYLLKDLGALYAGAVTTNGSSFFTHGVADHDSELTVRIKQAGLVIFGKTNTSELGLAPSSEPRLFGPTRNPWNPAYSAGGSSGGAAAAVASGILPMAHATDGGGSIRIPAACCGLFGLKPTRARTPSEPDQGGDWSGAAVAHAITRTVRDSAALLDATSGPSIGDPYWAPPPIGPYLLEVARDPGRLRIAFTTTPWIDQPVAPECVEATVAAARLCEELGHSVEEASPTIDGRKLRLAATTVVGAHIGAILEMRASVLGRDATPDDLERLTWARAREGYTTTAVDFAKSIALMHRASRELGHFFTTYDVLLTPTMCQPPYKLGVLNLMTDDPDAYRAALLSSIGFTSLFNAAGCPAMSVPLGWSRIGLPIGVQFAASLGAEAVLFRLASQLEVVQPWATRRPPNVGLGYPSGLHEPESTKGGSIDANSVRSPNRLPPGATQLAKADFDCLTALLDHVMRPPAARPSAPPPGTL